MDGRTEPKRPRDEAAAQCHKNRRKCCISVGGENKAAAQCHKIGEGGAKLQHSVIKIGEGGT
jgi:hypothetical protein